MPEGPEIRLAADRVAGVLVGQPVEDAMFALPALAPRCTEVVGATCEAVETRGKAMLTRFDNGLTLYSHNQLYGRWMTVPRGQMPDTNRSLRVALHTATQSALLYSASEIALLDAAGVAAHPFLGRLGPDILSPALDWKTVSTRLDEPGFRGRSLGALYLDQRFLAGLGNYLRSEILFAAGCHPARRPRDLSRAGRNRLARATLDLARRSYHTRGITNTDARVKKAKRRGEPRRHYRYAVFAREGLPCHRCAGPVERIVVGSRRLYLCPRCQV